MLKSYLQCLLDIRGVADVNEIDVAVLGPAHNQGVRHEGTTVDSVTTTQVKYLKQPEYVHQKTWAPSH